MANKKTGILFVEQDSFFFKIDDLPAGLGESDLRAYASTIAENSSPLQLDVLRWGFCAGNGRIMIFASSAQRLAKNKKLERLMKIAPRALPFAATLWGAEFPDGWSVVSRDGELGNVEYAAINSKSGKWLDVFSVSKKSGVSEETALENLRRLSGMDKDFKMYRFGLEKTGLGKFKFFARAKDGNEVSVTRGGFKFFSRADVRDPVSLRAAYKTIFNARLALSLFVTAVAFAAILALWNLSFFLQNSANSKLETSLGAIKPEAQKISEMGSEALFLNSLTSAQMNNLLMIAKINKSRPDGISFLKSSASSNKNIEIRGRSSSVALIKDFEKSLKLRPDIKSAVVQSSGSTAGGTSWTLNVEFK